MIRRPARESHPDRWPFAHVALPVPRDPEGRWCFRLMRWAKLSGLMERITRAGEAGDPAAMDEAYGRALAAIWADEEWALESDPEDGAAVFAELCDRHDWPPSVIYALINDTARYVASEASRAEEVRKTADFFGLNGVAHASMSSGSAGSTEATPSPSTA